MVPAALCLLLRVSTQIYFSEVNARDALVGLSRKRVLSCFVFKAEQEVGNAFDFEEHAVSELTLKLIKRFVKLFLSSSVLLLVHVWLTQPQYAQLLHQVSLELFS